MKHVIVAIVILILFLLNNLYAQEEFPILQGPYFGQKPPGNTPEIFAFDILVTPKQAHSNIVFSKDGKNAYWCNNGIWFSKIKNEVWTIPVLVPFSKKEYKDDAPFLSPDGKQLFFTSKRPVNDSDTNKKENIWVVDLKENGWSEARLLPPIVNDMFQHWQVSVDFNGNLYFRYWPNNDPKANSDIYCSRYIDGEYQKPGKLSNNINSEFNEVNPFISPEGNYIIFSRIKDRKPFNGGLFISFRIDDDLWSEAKPLSQYISFKYGGNCPIVSGDGKNLFFLDIYEGKWQRYWIDAEILGKFKKE